VILMTLDQLRIFVAVAERQHVTQGARDLNLTQSATSAAIAALEARYATKLFDRVGRGIALTDAGRLFLTEARAVLARAAAAEKVLVDLAELRCGSLTLGASQTVANYWLPAIIHEYRSRYPAVTVSLVIGNSEQVCSLVREGAADLGFIEAALDDPALITSPVAKDEMILVAAPDHPWAARRPRLSADFAAGPWVMREQGSGTRSIFEAALADWGLKPTDLCVVLELPSNEAVRAAVEAGAGVTAISKLVVFNSLRAGTLVSLDISLSQRSFFVLRHRERYLTKAVQAFLALAACARGSIERGGTVASIEGVGDNA
jgi:DNA-binding transcriptional LysR family regulator